jgi:CO/xanthine dehydrogenase FAD-binding subunit
MRADVPACDVRVPATLEEALGLLAREPGIWRPLAGGTDLMVPFASGRLRDTHFLSLQSLDSLRTVEEDDRNLTLGTLVTYTQMRESPCVRRHFPNLADSARVTGAVAIQNRGTLGGNIVNGSPAADTPPALLAYGAQVELTGLGGARWVPLQGFYTGYKQTVLRPDELLTRIRVPKPQGQGFHFYRKVGTRAAQAVAKVCLAAYGRVEGGIVRELQVGLGSVAPFPILAPGVTAAILGQALQALPIQNARAALMKDLNPIDDIRSTARYRRVVAGNVLEQMLGEMKKEG